ncbi:MAG: acetyl-CoA carboxylase carboxyltransferase subunit beta [Candidatus Aminicenantes bacterium]|nr:acetyl-CoA carboxylase carboxyltransferase subunit beta [Candidatus Aminicenantes bacterium]
MHALWTRCNNCRRILYKQDILDNQSICPACNFHFRLSAYERLEMLFDEGLYNLLDQNISPEDPLQFKDSIKYSQRLKENQKRTKLQDAVLNAEGTIEGIKVVISAMDFGFMGGSMGSVVGEKITRAVELALKERLPLIIVSCSGGARMQEGVFSLMQLMKTSSAIARLDKAGIPFISILVDPTTGGVTASFAMLGDINIGEPNALIGFAGPRVIEQTIKEKLPKGFQRAEFLLQHGMLDDVVDRNNMRSYLVRALRLFLNRPE